MEHIAKVRNRQVVDVHAMDGDLPGRVIPANNMGTDTLRIKFEDKSWDGHDEYSVIFWRGDDDTAPHKEYAIDYDDPVVRVPASLTTTPGELRFAVKALDPQGRTRQLTAQKNAVMQVTEGGVVDGSYGNDEELTRLEEALEKADNFEGLYDQMEDAVRRATDAAQRAEGIAGLDYNVAINKPSIEGVELKGNKELQDFGMTACTAEDIMSWFK